MKPQFTLAELDLICSMAAIADANEWGKGDYEDWDGKTAATMGSLLDKVSQLRAALERRNAAKRGKTRRNDAPGGATTHRRGVADAAASPET